MSQDSEKMKALVAFKKKLEERVENLDSELKETQAMLDVVNSILLEKGFKRGDIKKVTVIPEEVVLPAQAAVAAGEKPAQRAAEPESVIPLKTVNDESLAIIYVEKQTLHILPDESKHFSVNTPPFNNFLVERVLAKMQEKDNELVRMGQLTPDKMFAYNITREGDSLREIVVKNVDEERLRELKSSIRWTLEKMYEKMKS
jgi:acetylornithine deacetylase/succinyl-diaminopimelate desuccinylase-like protein